MGISGLLPLLKSVQKPTHLSELAGKTIAVDAYVWLHRGAYACAPELVTGQYTTKYIDYAMTRIRLLQHYKITPYLVFDGGPLPAKKGTEVERKRKRDEHLLRANALAQQGRHTEAREHYVKCVDITPQMAFQLIKALRVEKVSYIVAPYEADSQLAYLECAGIVDGILTEDSDLLIFGARLVLFKFDAPTATCTAISSDTLASNAPSDLALHGWGITELRACAMLSGCDYLEGVRGVGLKTAGKIMRRWGTIERALRSLRMDGKPVESDWEQRMRIAEAAFLHQRVWDPRTETIVYLTPPDMATWDEDKELFVGRHIEPELAGRLVRGDVDPITLEPMVDMMPSFQPTNHPRRPLSLKDTNRRVGLGPVNHTTPAKGSLLQYFAKKSKTATVKTPPVPLGPLRESATARGMHAGGASGKRTLAEQYDLEAQRSTKRPKIAVEDGVVYNSKFFAPPTPVECVFDDDKENLEMLEEIEVASVIDDVETDPVKQEDGYLSPSPVFSSPGDQRGTTPEFSSPLQDLRPCTRQISPSQLETPHRIVKSSILQIAGDGDDRQVSDDGRITSPPSGSAKNPKIGAKSTANVTMFTLNELQRKPGPEDCLGDVFSCDKLTVDLRGLFSESPSSGVSYRLQEISARAESRANCDIAGGSADGQLEDECIEDDNEDNAGKQIRERHRIVGAGWEKRFASTPRLRGRTALEVAKGKGNMQSRPTLRRCETMNIPSRIKALVPRASSPSRPRRSDPVGVVSPEWIPPARIIPTSTMEDYAADGEEFTGVSSPGAVVDDPDSTSPASRARIRLRAYRFKS